MHLDNRERLNINVGSLYFRKSKLKSDEEDLDESDLKIKTPKKETPSTSSPSSSSSTSNSLPTDSSTSSESPMKVEKEDINNCWYQLQDGGAIKDLLPSGMVKNSSKLRFDVKTISLSEDV